MSMGVSGLLMVSASIVFHEVGDGMLIRGTGGQTVF